MKTNEVRPSSSLRCRATRARVARGALAALLAVRALAPHEAKAEQPAAAPPTAEPRAVEEPSWDARYAAAYEVLSAGRFAEAATLFHALARTAPSERERVLAHELARFASESAESPAAARPVAPAPATPTRARPIRSTDELTLLYASGFMYGAGSGVWFLLATQPDSAVTATLPFAALTAAPVIAIATIDGISPLPRGVPHAISAGLYLGLGESIFLVGMHQARAQRVQKADPSSDARFGPETVAGVLWTGATLGATLGGALGAGLETTPGRVSFTASMTLWSGVLTGLTAGALLPDDERRRERAFTIGGAGYNAGLAGGLLFAGKVSPSVARVRLADLLAVAGGLVTAGAYLSLAKDIDVRAAEGLAAGGLGAGLAAGWLVTRGMAPDSPAKTPPRVVAQPGLVAVPSGAGLGVSGLF
jgi:hypothetical protein